LVDTWWSIRELMTTNPERALSISARRARTSMEEYQSYAEGTTLFSLEQNLEALSEGDCSASSETRIRFINCAIADIYAFLVDDAKLIPSGEALPAAKQRAMWDGRFVQDYARRKGR
jgi:NitT/TauT family transport system substrate-binding protein